MVEQTTIAGERTAELQLISDHVSVVAPEYGSKDEARTDEESERNDQEANAMGREKTVKESDQEKEQTDDFDKIIEHLTERDWNFAVERARGLVQMNCTGNNGTYRVYLQLKSEMNTLMVYIVTPTTVPAEKRLQVVEYLVNISGD